MKKLTRILYNALLILRIRCVRCFPGMFSGRNLRTILVSVAFFVFDDKTYSKDLQDNKQISYKNSI